ncbi:MAG: transglutaminase-like domain-containing protein [Planctomycetota bacterium]
MSTTAPRSGLYSNAAALLSSVHLLCLGGYLLLGALRFPSAGAALLLLALGALASESVPRSWRRRAIPELIMLATALLALLQLPGDQAAYGMLLRSFIAAWILIPARGGMLRLLPVLLITDALVSRHAPGLLIWLLPLGILALMVDAWMRTLLHTLPGIICNYHPPMTPLRWLLPVLPVAMLAGLAAGEQLYGRLRHLGPHGVPEIGLPPGGDRGRQGGTGGELDTRMHIGDHRWVDRSPLVMARITYGDAGIPPVAYLRALTTPDLELDGPDIIWSSPRVASTRLPPRPTLHPGRPGPPVQVLRMRGSSDVVLRPDGSAWFALADCLMDQDGNCYQAGLGLSTQVYAAGAGGARHPNTSDRLNAYRRLPPDLAAALMQRVPEIERWRLLTADEAAAAIVQLLRRRCSYAIQDLPSPPPEAGGTILQFLDGAPQQRIGHCQYFATAMCVLLRAAGFPARPVVGYASTERSDNGILFRALHAHAWVEVLDAERIWQRWDPTPPAALDLDAALLQDLAQAEALPTVQTGSSAGWLDWRRLLLIAAVPALLLLAWLLRRQGVSGDEPPIQRLLRQQRETLLQIAIAFGIEVRNASTITGVVRELEARSGIALEGTLQTYLAARFAGRGEPPMWPLEELRRAARRNRPLRTGPRSPGTDHRGSDR